MRVCWSVSLLNQVHTCHDVHVSNMPLCSNSQQSTVTCTHACRAYKCMALTDKDRTTYNRTCMRSAWTYRIGIELHVYLHFWWMNDWLLGDINDGHDHASVALRTHRLECLIGFQGSTFQRKRLNGKSFSNILTQRNTTLATRLTLPTNIASSIQ
jgi:hypothetical protein